jgi:signal transduction histidine kinase
MHEIQPSWSFGEGQEYGTSKCACGGTSDEIHLTVKDSGGGFDREAAKNSRSLGLIRMEERLKVLNGAISIDSQPKRGTIIHARVPFDSSGDSMRAAG